MVRVLDAPASCPAKLKNERTAEQRATYLFLAEKHMQSIPIIACSTTFTSADQYNLQPILGPARFRTLALYTNNTPFNNKNFVEVSQSRTIEVILHGHSLCAPASV